MFAREATNLESFKALIKTFLFMELLLVHLYIFVIIFFSFKCKYYFFSY